MGQLFFLRDNAVLLEVGIDVKLLDDGLVVGMLRLEAVQDGDARVGGALERAGIAEEEQVLGGVEDNQRISCLDKLAVDENTDGTVRPLDEELRLVLQQLAGIEPRGRSLDVAQEAVVER